MVPRETVSFVFPWVLMGKIKLTSSPRDHTLSVLLYINLDFPLNNHTAKTNKQRWHAGNNSAIVSWSGYIWIWSGVREQESTNHSAHFVEWKSSYITMTDIQLTNDCYSTGPDDDWYWTDPWLINSTDQWLIFNTVKPAISTHPKCWGKVVAYGRWSLTGLYKNLHHNGSKFSLIRIW